MNRACLALTVASLLACRPEAAPQQVPGPTTPRKAAPQQVPGPTTPRVTQSTPSSGVETETDFDSYASQSDDLDGWRLALARSGTRVRVILTPNSTSGTPVELEGSVTGEAGQRHIEAHARTSKQALYLSAVVDGAGKLHGTLRMQGAKNTSIDLGRGTTQTNSEQSWKERFGGTLGGVHRVRVDWEQSASRATMTLSRLGAVPRTFKGNLQRENGRFELLEQADPKSRLRGILMGGGGDIGIGEWLHDGLVEAVSLDRFYPTYPAAKVLPSGGRVVQAERFYRGVADCESSYNVFPRFEGVAAERLLNAEFEKLLPPKDYCIEATDVSFLGSLWYGSTYSVTAARGLWVGLAFEWNNYQGGTHGGSGEGCAVADTQSGKVGHLNEELTPKSFEKLLPLVRRAILQSGRGKSLRDLGFIEDDLKVNAKREMCVVESNGALFLEVVYQSDLDEAGNFRFETVRPRIAAASVRSLFPAGSLGALVFR